MAIDDVEAGALVGRHLADLGHRRVAVIADTGAPAGTVATGLQVDDITCIDCAARLRGLRTIFSDDLSVASGGHNADGVGGGGGRGACSSGPEPPDRDRRPQRRDGPRGAADAGRRGLAAPDDVSVVGFDDVPAAAEVGLTTVRQPIREKGRRVGELLLDPDAAERQVLLPIELIARRTTGPVS